MSYNGSGTFQINTSGQPVVTGTVISSSAFNALTADLATGLSTAITKDGQTATTVRIPFAQGINSSLATDATNTATGSIITAGGVGIAKALFVGTTANIAGAATFSSTITYGGVTLSASVTGTGKMVLDNTPTLINPTVTNYVESVVAIGTVTTTSTLALTNGTVQTATLTASTACTFTMPTATAGKSFVLLLKQAASTGNGTATFTSVKWGTAGAPTITATAGKMDILTFIADGTNWYGSIAQGYTP
jgi:hypothetical protein